jgi:hypothetical protein
MSAQIIPLKGRANSRESSRIPATETVRVLSCGCTSGLNIREDSRTIAFDISTAAARRTMWARKTGRPIEGRLNTVAACKSADQRDPFLGCRFGCGSRLCRKLEHCCFLMFKQVS